MELPSRLFSKRLKIITAFFITLSLGIIARLFYLQITLTLTLFSLAQRNFLRLESIASPRGNIVDCTGKLLATSRPIITLYWQGTGKYTFDQEQTALIQTLKAMFGVDTINELAIQLHEKRGKKLTLKTDIQLEQLSRILEQFPHQKNIVITTHFKRYYPHRTTASHIVGYLGALHQESTGKMGLERVCEDILKGTPGQLLMTINSAGRPLEEREIKQACMGATLQTTIDLDIQKLAEEVMPENYAGALLVMSPETGALQAVVSRPVFDPNKFLDVLDEQEWSKLQENQSFLNRAFAACYPPASIFKLVTVSIALEHDIIDTDTVWNCKGYCMFCGRPYHCANRQGHGIVTIKEALASSCNIPFFEIGKRIKIDTLADYAHRFGLGDKTALILSERAGLVPTAQWKRSTKGEPWWPGETLSAAIGQSFLLVTPLQVARMISAICQGYLVTPRILANQPIETKSLDISTDTLEFLKSSMTFVITHGTGKRLGKFSDSKIYAKTGTAQTAALAKHDQGQQYLEHAWFVAYISYKDYEPFTLVILLEHASSSREALSVATKFFMGYRKLKDLTEHSNTC